MLKNDKLVFAGSWVAFASEDILPVFSVNFPQGKWLFQNIFSGFIIIE
jgi:hypothetical protein